jgi:hypothetical protein
MERFPSLRSALRVALATAIATRKGVALVTVLGSDPIAVSSWTLALAMMSSMMQRLQATPAMVVALGKANARQAFVGVMKVFSDLHARMQDARTIVQVMVLATEAAAYARVVGWASAAKCRLHLLYCRTALSLTSPPKELMGHQPPSIPSMTAGHERKHFATFRLAKLLLMMT